MAFLKAVAVFLSQEVITRLGKDVLAEGQRVFGEELARGTGQKEAARKGAEHMLKYAAKKGRDNALAAGKTAARTAGQAASKGAQALKDKLGKK